MLTAYIPMLTDAGGNAGSQSTSTIIRSMAVGDIAPHDLPRIIWRECRVALMCGVTLAVCNFFKMLLLDRIAAPVALVVCVTLIFTVLLSQLIGVLLPVIADYHRGYHHAVDLLQRGQDGAAYLMQSF